MSDQAMARAFTLSCAAALAAAVTLALLYLPTTVVMSAHTKQQLTTIRQLSPQGWGFFTRDPREPTATAYRRAGATWRLAMLGPNAQARWWLGADRTPRAQEYELQLLQVGADGLDWVECGTDDLDVCLSGLEPYPVELHASRPVLCGEIALVREAPVAWAWASLTDRMPRSAKLLEVTCTHRDHSA